MPQSEVRQQARDDRGRRRREGHQPHARGAQPSQLGELAGGGIQRRRHGGGVPREDAAGIGEADAPPHPLDDGHAEALFEALELLADRRLAVPEGERRSGDRPGVGDRP